MLDAVGNCYALDIRSVEITRADTFNAVLDVDVLYREFAPRRRIFLIISACFAVSADRQGEGRGVVSPVAFARLAAVNRLGLCTVADMVVLIGVERIVVSARVNGVESVVELIEINALSLSDDAISPSAVFERFAGLDKRYLFPVRKVNIAVVVLVNVI